MILAVDDIPQNIRLLHAVLEPRGYAVAAASSGAEALARLAAGDVDLVLLDIVMPGMDGYEVCRRIRADPATAFLPVVMITASGEQEKRRALEAGADDFVTKPFEPAELLARVRSLLRIKRYHDEIGLPRAALPPAARSRSWSARPVGAGEPPARDRGAVVCALHGFAAFAETAEPEDVMRVLDAYHAALGGLDHGAGGTLARLTADGCWSCSTTRCRARTRRATRCGWPSRCATASGSSRRTGPGSASPCSRPAAWLWATRRSAGSGSSGAGSTRRSAPVPTLAERLCEPPRRARSWSSQRVFAAVESRRDPRRAG